MFAHLFINVNTNWLLTSWNSDILVEGFGWKLKLAHWDGVHSIERDPDYLLTQQVNEVILAHQQGPAQNVKTMLLATWYASLNISHLKMRYDSDSPISYQHKSLLFVVPVINSVENNSSHKCSFFYASCLIINMMTGYLLSQQPDTKHLSILGRQCHSPDVAHRLLNGTWLRSASHNRKSSEPHPPCDLLLWLSQHAALHWRLWLGVVVFT